MYGEAQNVGNRAREIHVPMDYYRCLGRYLDELKLSILDEAANHAVLDASKPGTDTVTIDDILHAASKILPEAESHLHAVLRQLESDDARKKAS